MKNPLTPAGIEPATYRFVAQHLNHCTTAVTLLLVVVVPYYLEFKTNPTFKKGFSGKKSLEANKFY